MTANVENRAFGTWWLSGTLNAERAPVAELSHPDARPAGHRAVRASALSSQSEGHCFVVSAHTKTLPGGAGEALSTTAGEICYIVHFNSGRQRLRIHQFDSASDTLHTYLQSHRDSSGTFRGKNRMNKTQERILTHALRSALGT